MAKIKTMENKNTIDMLPAKCTAIEIETLLHVLIKIEDFHNMEIKRIKKLESEIDSLKKMNSELKTGFCNCSVCNSLFVPFINSAYICEHCQISICTNCTIFIKSSTEMQLCKMCHTEWLRQVKSGTWLFEEALITNRHQSILEMHETLSDIENALKIHLKENLVKKQNKKSLSQNDKHFIDGLTNLKDEKSPALIQSGKSITVNDLSKSNTGPIYSFKSTVNTKKLNQLFGYDISDSSLASFSSSRSGNSTISKIQKKIHKPNANEMLERSLNSIAFVEHFDTVNENVENKATNLGMHSRNSLVSSGSSRTIEAFSNDFTIQGEIQLKIGHSDNCLKIRVLQCRNLSIANKLDNTTNPYVKIYLLPDKSSSSKRKTSTKTNSINPIFNQDLIYHISRNHLSDRTLNISVWHRVSGRTSIFIGELSISLHHVKLSDPKECWFSLKTRENVPHIISLFSYQGEILIGLQLTKVIEKKYSDLADKYTSGQLNLSIISGKNIGLEKNKPNSFIKCLVKHGTKQLSKKETKVIYNTTNPIWDEVFTFPDIYLESLSNIEIEITILDKKIMKTKPLGYLFLTTSCSETNVTNCLERDVSFWRKFTNNKEAIEEYLPIRSVTN